MGTTTACPAGQPRHRQSRRRVRPERRRRGLHRSRNFAAPMMSTSDDIRYLIGLARDKSVESRKRLVAVVSDIFFSDQAILTEYERALITDILHKLIYELAAPVREVLSAHLGRDEATPRAVLRALAEDEIEIAAPIL